MTPGSWTEKQKDFTGGLPDPTRKGNDFVTVELWGSDQNGDRVAVGAAQVIIPQ